MSERIEMWDLSTITQPSTWLPAEGDPDLFTHPGVPVWAIRIVGPNAFLVLGVNEHGEEGHPFGTYKSWDDAVAIVAYCHGA